MSQTNHTLIKNCTDLLDADYDEIVLLSAIVGAVCGFSFIVAGIIYCCRKESYASSLKKAELHCLLEAVSIVAFVYDVSSDIFLSVQYYMKGHLTYFLLTTIFIVMPVFFGYTATIALVASKSVDLKKCRWCFSIFAAVIFGPVAAVFVHLIVLIYSLGSGPDKRLSIHLSPAVHGILEISFESIPQLLLQVYINVNTITCDEDDIKTRLLRYFAVGGSAMDIIVAMYVYKNYLCERLSPIAEIGLNLKLASFFKKLFLIGIRIIMFALFLSEFTFWFFMFAIYRFMVCIVVSFVKLCFREETKPEDEMSSIKRFVISVIDAFVNLFIVVKFSDYKGSFKYLKCLSYIFIHIENAFLFITWLVLTTYSHTWYYWPSIGAVIAGIFCYIICEVIFYILKNENKVHHFTAKRGYLW